MHVQVVTQYFPPEVGATQNRLGTFVDGLADRGHEVTVVCEQPNHPAGVFEPGYGRRPVATERDGRRTVHRLWVATAPDKSTTRRLAFYGTFAAGAGVAGLALRRPDVVFASSPPLPAPLAVAAAARARNVPFVADVRDLWPAAAEALGELSDARLIRSLERAERWLYRTAARVTATTVPFCAHIDRVSGQAKSVHIPNGALDELLDVRTPERTGDGPFNVGYAGNLGIAQGLGIVLDAAELLRSEPVRFTLVGEGPLKRQLAEEIGRRGLERQVELRPSVPVTEIGEVLASFDALLIPLRDHELLRDFIPSKLYDAMAVGRPVLVAADGEPRRLVETARCGISVRPEGGAMLADAVRRLRSDPALAQELGAAGRLAARDFVRSRQVERLERVLLEAAGAA